MYCYLTFLVTNTRPVTKPITVYVVNLFLISDLLLYLTWYSGCECFDLPVGSVCVKFLMLQLVYVCVCVCVFWWCVTGKD